MRNNSPEKSRYFIHSLAKGLRFLQILAEAGRPLSLSQIATEMETNKTGATRLCYTLSELGFIQRDERKYYYLAPEILRLGYPAVCGMGWRDIAKFYLKKLFEQVNETVSMSVLDGHEILFILRFRKKQYLPFDIRLGTRIPVHCTAMGKVLMAFTNPGISRAIIDQLDFKPLTTRTITDKDTYLRELEMVRHKGYAINDEEMSIGNRSISAPVLDQNGYAVAALVIAAPTKNYTMEEMEKKFHKEAMDTAKRISRALNRSENTPEGAELFFHKETGRLDTGKTWCILESAERKTKRICKKQKV